MQYFGGKAGTVGKRHAELCSRLLTPSCTFVDMFCGSMNVIRHVKHPYRMAIDGNHALINMWTRAQHGWIPPKTLSAEDYYHLKDVQDPTNPLTAFAGFGCSFGGKWFGGYAKDRPQQRYAECAANQIVAKVKDLQDVAIRYYDYRTLVPGALESGTVIYCDPPYAGTTQYGAMPHFNPEEFWRWCRGHVDAGVHVIVSEYTAPLDWLCVEETKAIQGGRLVPGKTPRVDRLFIHRSVA
jgi:DNA adenine methylase